MNPNIIELVLQNSIKYPDKEAIIHHSRSINYKSLIEETKLTATYLNEKGLQKGVKILIFVPMSIQLYKILLATFYIGATAVFLDAWSNKKRLEQAVKIADCKAFIGIPKAHLLRLTSKEIQKIPVKIITGLNKLKPINPNPISTSITDPSDIALITFTTGSTEEPKAAKRTHSFLFNQNKVLKEHLNPQQEDIELTTLPIFVLNNLANGITSVIPNFNPIKPEKIKPAKIINEINKYKITTSVGSPVFYDRLGTYCIENNIMLNNLTHIFLGGAPVFPALANKLLQAFPQTKIEIVYGSTEAEPISAIDAKTLADTTIKTINTGLLAGKPINQIDLKIIKITNAPIIVNTIKDFNALEVPQGEVGEICVTGDHVLKEYYNSPKTQKANKIYTQDTIWHRTGDAGYIAPDGNLFLMGRKNNTYVLNNKNHFVFPIEDMLQNIPSITMGTLLQVKDKLYIIIETNKHNHSQIKKRISELQIPYDEIKYINKIPRDPRHNSKIDYTKLKTIINT